MSQQSEHFDGIADAYDATIPRHVRDHYVRKRVALLGPLLAGGKGLDVGCGTGVLMEALRGKGHVTGVDPSEGMLTRLREAGRGEAVQAPADALPFDDDSFDLAYAVAVFHHLIDPAVVMKALAEMVRVTRPGGKVVVWDHNPLNPYWPIIMKRSPQDRGDERVVPQQEIIDGLQAAGARIVRAFRSGLMPDFAPPCLLAPARALEWLVERLPLVRNLCAHNVIVAAKATNIEHPQNGAAVAAQAKRQHRTSNIQHPTSK